MKDEVENKEIILDTSGTECPIPVLKARKLSENLIQTVETTYQFEFFI